ncbi:MAG: DUF6273 domain-containing protein [Lachnospiraceae bacterium]|nr:DUF6273 domain-containing protein [Lachnospiraceae bacterium]
MVPTPTPEPTKTPTTEPTEAPVEGAIEWHDKAMEAGRWLNSDFYRTAFSEKERASIAETLVRNADNPEYGTEGGNDTRDKVFLLSIEEATTYFDSDPDAWEPARREK